MPKSHTIDQCGTSLKHCFKSDFANTINNYRKEICHLSTSTSWWCGLLLASQWQTCFHSLTFQESRNCYRVLRCNSHKHLHLELMKLKELLPTSKQACSVWFVERPKYACLTEQCHADVFTATTAYSQRCKKQKTGILKMSARRMLNA